MISALSDEHIVKVACGSFYAHTLCVTSQGRVYSWGDGDYGKLGRGGSDGSKLPRLVEKLQNVDVSEVYCGAQFSVALTVDGKVFTWGKGEGWKLGHPTEEHVRFPEMVEALSEKCVVAVSLGVSHVMALTDQGEVYGWGKNENRQVCDTSELYVQQPRLVEALKGQKVVGVCCGPAQSFAWTNVNSRTPQVSIPFVIELSEQTFK
jgi:E3 ubiquitin-protein ligase HERC2